MNHSGPSCNTGREVPEGIKKALWLEISFNLGKVQLWKTLSKSFPKPCESHNTLWKLGEAFCLPLLKVHDSQSLILGETWFLFGSAGNSIKTQCLVERVCFYAAAAFFHLRIFNCSIYFFLCLYTQHISFFMSYIPSCFVRFLFLKMATSIYQTTLNKLFFCLQNHLIVMVRLCNDLWLCLTIFLYVS